MRADAHYVSILDCGHQNAARSSAAAPVSVSSHGPEGRAVHTKASTAVKASTCRSTTKFVHHLSGGWHQVGCDTSAGVQETCSRDSQDPGLHPIAYSREHRRGWALSEGQVHPHRDRPALPELFPESQSSAAVGSRASSPHYSCSRRLLELSYQRHALVPRRCGSVSPPTGRQKLPFRMSSRGPSRSHARLAVLCSVRWMRVDKMARCCQIQQE